MMRRTIAVTTLALAATVLTGAVLAGNGLLGTYATKLTGVSAQFGGVWTITFTAGGKYTVRHRGVIQGTGIATIKPGTISFHDLTGKTKCTGAQAPNLYRYTLTDTTLRFIAVRDKCARKFVITQHPWKKTA
jgi:hypothetical protein